MGHYTKYSGGNQHLRMDMDHERRLIHDAKDDIYKEDRDLRDRKSAAHYTKEEEDLSLEGGTMPVVNRATTEEADANKLAGVGATLEDTQDKGKK